MPLARHVLLHWQEPAMPDSATPFHDAIEGTASTVSQNRVDAIDETRGTAADCIGKARAAVRENAKRLPGEAGLSGVARAAGGKLGASARYVREHDAGWMMTEVETLVKNNPGPSLLSAAVLGFLAGRTFRNN
jgi:hypothetical protein